MSDPFEPLKQQEAGMVDSPLPAAEVRARGDRMRRRRTAFRAVAAAAAVAVVTTGGVALGGGLPTTAPAPPPATQGPQPSPPAPGPTAETSRPTEPVRWQTTIPDDFPLAAGWPDAADSRDGETLTGPGRGLDALELGACGRTVPDPGGTDRLNAVWANVVNAMGRELRVFADDQAAVTHLAHLRNLWQECDPGEGGDDLLRRVRPTELGAESFALVTGSQFDETTEVTLGIVQVVRIGNAVFADQISTEGGLADMDGDVTDLLAGMAADSQPVIEAMGQFGKPAGPATTDDTPPSPQSWQTEIPADFRLALGYPEDQFEETELVGPGPTVTAFDDVRACGTRYETVADQTDRLAVRSEQPEDTRARELTLHASDSAAHENLLRLVDLFRSCPREDVGFGGVTLTEVRQVEPGDEGYVMIRTFEQDGLPSLGLQLIYAIRVGNALLLSSTSNEGGTTRRDIKAQVRNQFPQVDALADEMCVFARGAGGGC